MEMWNVEFLVSVRGGAIKSEWGVIVREERDSNRQREWEEIAIEVRGM